MSSGTSLEDIAVAANAMYKSATGKNFQYSAAWGILKDTRRFSLESISSNSDSDMLQNADIENDSAVSNCNSSARPSGRKKQKTEARLNKREVSSISAELNENIRLIASAIQESIENKETAEERRDRLRFQKIHTLLNASYVDEERKKRLSDKYLDELEASLDKD